MAKIIIGVFGAGTVPETSWEWRTARETGQLIARQDSILLTGGLGGVMSAASAGAREEGGLTVGILPGDRQTGKPPNRYVDIPIYTGMGEARNVINVKSCDAAIAIGGEYGTLSEIALALKCGCPLVLLDSWDLHRRPGQTEEETTVLRARNAVEAVKLAIKAIKRRPD